MAEVPLNLIPLENSFEGQRSITLTENVPFLIGRQVDANDVAPNSVKFTSKVVSRKHAVFIYQDRKIYLQDTKSSSGTFLNDQRLSPQAMESSRVELHSGDVIRLGEDCEVNGVLYQSVCWRIILPNPNQTHDEAALISAGLLQVKESDKTVMPVRMSSQLGSANHLNRSNTSLTDRSKSTDAINMGDPGESFMDISGDVQFKLDTEIEFNAIWTSLTHGLDQPIRRLKALARTQALNMMNQGMYAGFAPPMPHGGSSTDLTSTRQSYLSGMHAGSSGIFNGNGTIAESGDQPQAASRAPGSRMSRLGGSGGVGFYTTTRSRQPSSLSATSIPTNQISSITSGPVAATSATQSHFPARPPSASSTRG